ncbi:MAG TPA: hypothetical protein PK251_09710 [Candidatus Latescibacteria bacterium]|nr:hypothetical protein [Candidatus Latescibacterota bacterium]HOS65013.1 hypothetical protein [Candidatus Latescibacterota bacterium]HPK74187.1 hypothetical protein [Candidatus Latescibacterota bacterium]
MRRLVWVLALALSAMVAACGGGQQEIGPTARLGGSNTRIRIVNDLGSYTIRYVYISPASDDSWGSDRLGASQVLRPGQSETWDIDPGTWDLRVKDEDGDTYTKRGIRLSSGKTYVWTVRLSDLDRRRR